MAFVHLHTHSEYSLLDGANRIPDLLDRVVALGMDSLAITDHGNLHGAWTFYEEAQGPEGPRDPGLRGLPGLRRAGAPARSPPTAPGPYSHLVLLARNRDGLSQPRQALVDRVPRRLLPPAAHRPRGARAAQGRADRAWPPAWLGGDRAATCARASTRAAKASAEYFARLFGPDGFWLEVQNHGIAEEETVTAGMFRLSPGAGHPGRGHQRRPLPAQG